MAEILSNFEELLDNGQNSQQPEIQEPEVITPPNVTSQIETPDNEGDGGSDNGDEGDGENEPTVPDYSDNPLYAFLQSRGITDPAKLQYEDEDGKVTEVDFATLSAEEQQEIIKEVTDPGLSEAERNTISYLRKNNATLEQVVDYFAQKRLEEYLNEHPEAVHQKTYSIDDYEDDELYFADLKAKYPDFSDEELKSKLEAAKANEDLFKKEVDVLRTAYKNQEDQERAAAEQMEAQQAEDLRNELLNAAGKFNEIALDYTDEHSDTLVIEDADKQVMMAYLLEQDPEGKSQLMRDLDNPDTLIELA